ncbi:AAA family ATPase [Haloplasma contractile]|uniref:Glutathionylspermidine synthase protein n=1 Tax=Haloplasma contractile SSD-17B TaxID=1033810 RepID=F7Q0U4_9MOLU|nr:AAA family ATPase [Haloplasma contractile]ERJ11318.1 glutathionylspermidine synthase protein [Haloplasma contractile SSD-17B]
MKLVIIFGPHAVGKMTIGQELATKTGLKLFHNHMTIDLLSNFFEFGDPGFKRLNGLFRREIFEEVSKGDSEGLIFTYMWALDQQSDWEYVHEIMNLFKERDADVYLVELEADFDARIERNKTPNRLENKPTKRNVEKSEKTFRYLEDKYRLNSYEGEIKYENYIKINNTNLEPNEVAKLIVEKFTF